MHKFQHPIYPLQAIPALLEHGAQFVLCDYWGNRKSDGSQSKKPVHRNWRRQRPGFVAVKDHITRSGLLGIVPASLGCAVLDVDHGNPVALIATHLPWFLSPTQRQNRLHLWYQDPQGDRHGGRWRHASGCAGELLASTGYVVLWGQALQGLADSLQDQVFGQCDQVDFDAVTAATGMTWAGPGERISKGAIEVTAEELPELADVLPGHRNVSLFHHVRYYAYRQVKHHTEFLDFADEVASFADACRDQLLDVEGFPESEAAGIASSVATWTWAVFARDGGGQRPEADRPTATSRRPALGDAGYRGDPALNSDSEVQRWRRGRRTAHDVVRLVQRRAQVAARFRLGAELPNLATAFGCTKRTILRDLEAAELPSRRQARRLLQADGERRRKRGRATADRLKVGGGETSLQGTGGNRKEDRVNPGKGNPTHPTFQSDAPRRSPLI